MQLDYSGLINGQIPTNKPMIGIQLEPIIRPRWPMNERKGFVTITRVSRASSRVTHFTSQIDTTKQSYTNDGIVKNMILPRPPFHGNQLRLISSLPSQPVSSIIHQQKLLEPNEMLNFFPRTLTATNDRVMHLSKISSFTTSFNSIDKIEASHNSLKSQLIIQPQTMPHKRQQQLRKTKRINKKRSKRRFAKVKTIKFNQTGIKKNINRNHKVCHVRLRYCFLVLIPIALLLLMGLSAMFVGIFANKTTKTSTTSTTATTSTSTTSTSTTTTTTTSTTTSTTSTSTTSTTTSTTSSTTTSTSSSTTTSTTSSTSSTSTSSTSTTSTTTTSQTTTTSTSTTTTTANPCGTPASVGSSSNLYYATSSSSSYTCQYLTWIASTTGSVTLSFLLRNDIASWYLDDVSVLNGNTEMLVNGGFESGSFSPGWTKTPSGSCAWFTPGGSVDASSPHTGTYDVTDQCWNPGDTISQSFLVTAGQTYFVSFWVKSAGIISMDINVTLS